MSPDKNNVRMNTIVKLNAASIQRKFPEIGLELKGFNKNLTITKDGCFFLYWHQLVLV